MMNNERINYLLQAYQAQTITPREKTELDQILDQNWNGLTEEEVDLAEIPGYERILLDIKKQPQRINPGVNWWFRLVMAAAAILIALTTTLYYFDAGIGKTESAQFTNDIAPGKNGATLTLANGKKIQISDALTGNVAKESGIKISRNKDGILVYEILASENEAKSLNNSYNTLATTSGEQIQVRLQDGTQVFLNTESTIKYPTSFINARKRQVSLSGEAYFEVAKDKAHPFIVDMVSPEGTGIGQSVEVLGTSFNITNYANEATVKTTLLEGSVNVILQAPNGNDKQTLTLKPGEQAIVNESKNYTKNVEIEDVVAWKNGYFMFNNETLENIMKKVSRWYNVDVVYKDEAIKQKTFFGSVSRFDHVSEVLKLLQKTGGASFQITGKQIIVNQKK